MKLKTEKETVGGLLEEIMKVKLFRLSILLLILYVFFFIFLLNPKKKTEKAQKNKKASLYYSREKKRNGEVYILIQLVFTLNLNTNSKC